MFKNRLPKRGQKVLNAASLIFSMVIVIGLLALEDMQPVLASAANISGQASMPLIANSGAVVDASRGAGRPSPTPIPTTWRSVFSEDFNGDSLDSSKWSAAWDGITGVYGPVNAAETACYDSSNLSFHGDGTLHMQLISKQETCKGAVRPNAGALIHSNGKFQFSYGLYEVRAYLPAAPDGTIANWPAIWSDGQHWPRDGEIDTLEGLGGKACFNFHYSRRSASPICHSGDFTGWHTFASDWEPGSITYYYDGVQVGKITTGITSAPEYLILNYTQGSWGGPTSVPATMQIDYVRVWQH